jgi:hypothetical protein
MVFSRFVVASAFLVTVILIPVTIPESALPDLPASVTVAVSVPGRAAEPAAAAPVPAPRGLAEPTVLPRLGDADPRVRRAAFDELAAAGSVPSEAAPILASHLDEEYAREGLLAVGAPAAESLVKALGSPSPLIRAAAAYTLARLAPIAWRDEIVPVAIRALGADDCTGNARLGVQALVAVGPAVRPSMRALVESEDDQVVACAIAVLARTGGASASQVRRAEIPLRRLALQWPGCDEAEAAVEAYRALGAQGETLMRAIASEGRTAVAARAVEIRRRSGDPARASWTPEGRLPNLKKAQD